MAPTNLKTNKMRQAAKAKENENHMQLKKNSRESALSSLFGGIGKFHREAFNFRTQNNFSNMLLRHTLIILDLVQLQDYTVSKFSMYKKYILYPAWNYDSQGGSLRPRCWLGVWEEWTDAMIQQQLKIQWDGKDEAEAYPILFQKL